MSNDVICFKLIQQKVTSFGVRELKEGWHHRRRLMTAGTRLG